MGLVVIDDSKSLVLVVDSRDVADLDDLVLYLALWYSRGVYFLIEHLLWTLIFLLRASPVLLVEDNHDLLVLPSMLLVDCVVPAHLDCVANLVLRL